MKSDIPPHQDPEEGLCPPLARGYRGSLLVSGFFALLDEGNGFRSKAVGHFIRSQGDAKNVLMVAVVILRDRSSQDTALKCQPRAQRGTDMLTHRMNYP